ncbi:uncharacterized protein [Amphiura filiformis]|uniref:uncharacterized protein n=1 Tax=Amphiura filiformis TaxID=82378 RepID=UPI003B2137C7
MPRGDCGIGMFQCSRSGECIPISFLCDFLINCHDGSDEDQCVYPECNEDDYTCSDGQCIDKSKRCDLIKDCTTGSDEELCGQSIVGFQCYDGTWLPAHAYCDGQRDCAGKNWEDEPLYCEVNNTDFTCGNDSITCKNGACVESNKRCIYGRDKYNFPIGCRDSTHLEQCADFQCPNDTLKCPDSYCIPLRNRCDDSFDCPNGEDEAECSIYQCPGNYRCHGSTNCVTQSQVCDGVRDCSEGDDEMFCGFTCMDSCTCIGLYISCNGSTRNRTHHLTIPGSSRELHLTHLHITGDLKAKDTIQNRLLVNLKNMPFLTIL